VAEIVAQHMVGERMAGRLLIVLVVGIRHRTLLKTGNMR
jgi:hypothetical protein